MIKPEDVPPFGNADAQWFATQETAIDAALRKSKRWDHTFENPERWPEIARRYDAAGWYVRVDLKGLTYEIRIMHPSLAFPPELFSKKA